MLKKIIRQINQKNKIANPTQGNSSDVFRGTDISILETKVAEEIAIQAEELLDDDYLGSINQVGKNRWELVIIDNNLHYDTTLVLDGGKLKSYDCNCNRFDTQSMCSHVLVSGIAVRKKIDAIRIEKKKGSRDTLKMRSGIKSIQPLLNSLSKTELEDFLTSMSRKSPHFRLLLQARFLEHLNPEHLEGFIEQIFPALQQANQKLPASRINSFIEISNELKVHFKNLLSSHNLIEAYNLAYLHLKKTFYIKHQVTKEHLKLEKLHQELLANFKEIFKMIEAPEYKEFIVGQLVELLSASYISANKREEQELWIMLLLENEGQEFVRDLSNQHLIKSRFNDYESLYFIKTLEILSAPNPEKIIELIIKKDTQETYRIIHILINYKYLKEANLTLQLFYVKKELNHPLSKITIENIEPIAESSDELESTTLDNLFRFRDIFFIDQLIRISGLHDRHIDRIRDQLNTITDLTFKGKVLLKIGHHKDAIALLSEHLTWELLKNFDATLIEIDEKVCLQMYQRVMNNFLGDHFGRHAQDFIKEVFDRVQVLGAQHWLRTLKTRIQKDFPERKFKALA